ncbi:MAG: cob(I)yrinic acid a,c-diamide adenosyltransferase [bacterium]|nr:cob(I)yrinic acid a,c-diamide adenosyltransferase [bacterium]
MPLFYTGKGDKGKSDLGKKKVSKLRPEVLALANLDELNSLLGLVKNQKLPKEFPNILDRAQESLFIVQAHIGCLLMGKKYRPPAFIPEKVRWAEKIIDALEKEVKPGKGFVVPGADPASAWLHFVRAVSRRTEISLVPLKKKIEPPVLSYMNRLSSLLYAMARAATKRSGKKERNPSYK